ncbi:MAG: alpha/beta fold hydrolase [Gemmatimonadaceae bacterium]
MPEIRRAREEQFRFAADTAGRRALLRHLPPPRGAPGKLRAPVLFIHGATFPSALAAGFRLDGESWMDAMSAQGYDVWALDFIGYGGSERYEVMRQPPEANAPLGRAPEAARQIAAAVGFVRFNAVRASRQPATRVSLIAHSWGSIPAGLYVSEHPEAVERLVQFGPIAPGRGTAPAAVGPAYVYVTEDDQRSRFRGYVPKSEDEVFDAAHLAAWCPAYIASDPTSHRRSPSSVAVPGGPAADLDAADAGHLGYDPGAITVPVLIVRGEWDSVCTDADAQWLYDALTGTSIKRNVTISRGTHVMHLESSRVALYREVAAFLDGDERPAPPRRDIKPLRAAPAWRGRS